MIQRMFVTLDTKKTNYKNVGKINHGDDLILELTVLSDGDMISFNDPMVDLLVKKSDGKMIRQNSGIERIKPNKFIIEVKKDCVTSPGLSTNQLIINDNGRISTCMFYYTVLNSLEEDVMPSISNVEVLEQLDEFVVQIQDKMEVFDSDLTERMDELTDGIVELEKNFNDTSSALNEAEVKRSEAEQLRAQAEALRVQNEDKRAESENVRVQNESDRAAAELIREQREVERVLNDEERHQNESERAMNEELRQQNESVRQSNESVRISNENDRKTQENRRVTAETNRVNAETTRRNNENSRISNEIERQKTLTDMKNLIGNVNDFDERVGVIEDEIEEINSSLDSMGNGISINAKSYGLIGDRITDNTEKFQELCNLALTYGQLEIILEDGDYITKQLLIYPNTTFRLSKNAKIVRHKEAYMLFCNLNSGMGVEYTEYNGGYFELTGGYLDGNWEETDIDGKYFGETGAFGHLSRFTIKDTIIVDGANGDHIFDICGCDNVTFDNVEFRGVHGNTSPSECIQIDMMISGAFPSGGSYDGTPTKNVLIQNCKFIPNLDNSKSKMMCPIGSHGSNGTSTYKNIKITNNYFKDITGNTVNNGIAFQYCYDAEIKNNIFDYSNITLQAPIIDFYVQDSQTICPFENIKIEGNVFKLNDCTINDKQAIRVYANRNRAFRIPNVTIKDNQCSNLNIHVVSCNNVNITNNDFSIIEGGWFINSNIEYNRLNQVYMQYTENTTYYKNKFLATANNHQLYRSAGTNKNLQILDNTFDGGEFTGVTALKWITSELIKVNDNTFINCTPWDNDWNGMTSTEVEFLRNTSNTSKDVKIKRATGMINASYNVNFKYELSANDIIFNSNTTDFFNSSATKSIVMSNNSITNGRIVVYSTPSINVNNNVITNPTPSNTAITVNACKGIVANNVFIQTDDNTSYPNILININDASNVVTTNNDTRNAKVNTSFINNANEGVVIHRNLNKKIFMLKVNSSNQLELAEITST